MIVEEKLSYVELVLRVRGGVLPRIWLRVLGTTVLAVVLTGLEHYHPALRFSLTLTPFTLIGIPLGIFLGFRNNTSYDRFWEGRRLWGQLVNVSRTFTRQVQMLIRVAPEAGAGDVQDLQVELVHRLIAFVHALRLHLRRQSIAELGTILSATEMTALEAERNVPNAVLAKLAERIGQAYQDQHIHPMHLPLLEVSLGHLTDIQGGCERIRNTPLPFSYTVLLHQVVAAYCFLLPFGLYSTIGLATPAVVLFISYALFGLDAIGDELENPFGIDCNDLPLLALSTMIEADVRRRLGESKLPDPILPVRDHLI